MVSPVVIGGFAALDAALLGQLAYALRSYERRGEGDRAPARGGGSQGAGDDD